MLLKRLSTQAQRQTLLTTHFRRFSCQAAADGYVASPACRLAAVSFPAHEASRSSHQALPRVMTWRRCSRPLGGRCGAPCSSATACRSSISASTSLRRRSVVLRSGQTGVNPGQATGVEPRASLAVLDRQRFAFQLRSQCACPHLHSPPRRPGPQQQGAIQLQGRSEASPLAPLARMPTKGGHTHKVNGSIGPSRGCLLAAQPGRSPIKQGSRSAGRRLPVNQSTAHFWDARLPNAGPNAALWYPVATFLT